MRVFAIILLLIAFFPASFAKTGGKGAGIHANAPGGGDKVSGGSSSHSGGGGMNRRLDPRHVPPLATGRRVHEQDCSKPIDWTSGNVKCK